MIRVQYICPFAQATGYAQAAHDYLVALVNAGIEVSIEPMFECDTDDLPERYDLLAPLANRKIKPTHLIVHGMPRSAPGYLEDVPAGVKKICVTTWETRALPESIGKVLDQDFDAIVVPSMHCQLALIEGGVPHDKVRIVAHAFAADHWIRERFRDSVAHPYRFYNIGVWGQRKNQIGLLAAYVSEFTVADNVELVLLSHRPNKDAIASFQRATFLNPETLPAVELFDKKRLTDEELYILHAESHCYVSVSRGEGWGLGAFEACAVGNPVIVPQFGGSVDFVSQSSGWHAFVPGSMTPALCYDQVETTPVHFGGQKFALRSVRQVAPIGVDARQHWLEPDLSALQEHMRFAYQNRLGQAMYASMFTETDVTTTQRAFRSLYGYEQIGRAFRAVLESV